jgi:hypothetical protein
MHNLRRVGIRDGILIGSLIHPLRDFLCPRYYVTQRGIIQRIRSGAAMGAKDIPIDEDRRFLHVATRIDDIPRPADVTGPTTMDVERRETATGRAGKDAIGERTTLRLREKALIAGIGDRPRPRREQRGK